MNKSVAILQHVPVGGSAVIAGVRGPERAVRRISELGLLQGTAIKVIRKAPFGGPIELCVDGVHVAIRLADGLSIDVYPDA